jgi:hypothetical protein
MFEQTVKHGRLFFTKCLFRQSAEMDGFGALKNLCFQTHINVVFKCWNNNCGINNAIQTISTFIYLGVKMTNKDITMFNNKHASEETNKQASTSKSLWLSMFFVWLFGCMDLFATEQRSRFLLGQYQRSSSQFCCDEI